MLNKAILMGRLVADPELRQTQNGISVTSFAIAIDRSYSKDREKQTDFIDIVAWRQTAEFVCKYFSKGKMIIVDGAIQTRLYEDKHGNKRKAVEVVADNVQFGESKKSADSAPSTNTPAQTATQAPQSASQSSNSATSSAQYATPDVGDFSEMDGDSDDLPF